MPENTLLSGLQRGERVSEIAAILVLVRSDLLAADLLTARLEETGSAVAVLQDVERAYALALPFTREDVEQAARTAEEWRVRRYDMRLVFDRDYPRNLHTIYNKPPFLFVRGQWDDRRDSVSVAVVGTRKATREGLIRAAAVARRLARAGITVISGLAAGIDTAAHMTTLEEGGRTIAVMGTGLDHVYPPANAPLALRIAESGGALVTQFLPHQPPARWSFPMRNVVTSGLSVATVVIEAGETSGAKSQARHALEHGRAVYFPKSLVEAHAWAQKMVTVGAGGVRAIQIESPDEIVERLTSVPDDLVLAM
jgi:DNA processing protein